MPKISQKAMDARRDEILAAAVRCFARLGIQGTTMRDILAESGLSTGAVYNYFRGKDDIIAAVVAQSSSSTAALLGGGDASEAPPAFRDVVEALLAVLEGPEARERARMTKMVYTEAAVTPELLVTIRKGRARLRELARARVAEFRPGLSPAQHAALVDFVFLLYQGMVTETALDEAPNIAAMREIIDLVLASYPAAPGSAPKP